MVRDSAFSYCQEQLTPHVLDAFRHEKTDRALFREMGYLGLLGVTIPEVALASVMCAMDLSQERFERVDSGYRSMMSV